MPHSSNFLGPPLRILLQQPPDMFLGVFWGQLIIQMIMKNCCQNMLPVKQDTW